MKLFYNFKILKDFQSKNKFNALIVSKNKFSQFGEFVTLKSLYPPIEIIDLKGRLILPGFNDSHIHIWKVGNLMTYMLDLSGVNNFEEIKSRIENFNKTYNRKWIIVRGFNELKLDEKIIPDRIFLDTINIDKPITLIRNCAHIITNNSLALKHSNISNSTEIPNGGEIRRDSKNNISGILTERAIGLVMNNFPKYEYSEYEKMILVAQDELIKKGITSATDPAVHPELLEVYKEMDKKKLLKIRINAIPIKIPDGVNEEYPLPGIYKSELLTINTLKYFSDGGLSGMTAAVSTPYKNTNYNGVLRLEKNQFLKSATECVKNGFKIATHAIGDVAINMVMDVYEELSKISNRKNRIEHFGIADDKIINRAKNIGVEISTQPIFIKELGDNFINSINENELQKVYPFKKLFEAGIPVSFSSDAPVVKDYNPFVGIYSAVTRKTDSGKSISENEKCTITQSIIAFTKNSAILDGVENKGKIAENYLADFIVLDYYKDEITGNDLLKIKVEEVFIGGKKVL